MDYSSIANLPNLGPGSTGPDVVKMQQWLVANGFMTQAQMNSGPGTYGPQTTAAVASWQQKAGINTAGNPGWFGPLSKTYISQQTTAPKTAAPTTTTQPTTASSLQKSMLSAVSDVAASAATTGKPPVSFAEALSLAAKDPTIVAKYSDMAKLDAQSFAQSLDQLRSAQSVDNKNMQMSFENERKQLAEANAAAGTAYSGFRGKAQAQLAQTESGIVTSSRSALQKNVNDLTTAFESKYGSGSATPATASFMNPMGTSTISASGQTIAPSGGAETISGAPAGGIVGSVAPAKTADINSSAINSYNTALFPAV